jgi:hypothetical protein
MFSEYNIMYSLVVGCLGGASRIGSNVLKSKEGEFALLILNLRVEGMLGLFISGKLYLLLWLFRRSNRRYCSTLRLTHGYFITPKLIIYRCEKTAQHCDSLPLE